MATSGSVDYLITRNEIITEALELLGVLANGDTANTNDVTSCSRTLNMMVKHWQARGVMLWKSQEIYVFLADEGQYYDLGPTGDHATASFVKTEVATAADSGASTIEVDDDTGISDADAVGVELDDGTLQWTTVNGAPSSDTITLTASLTDDVSVDANVFTYTTITNRPLFISEGRLHQDSGTEIPLTVVAGNDYKRISTKTSSGKASQIWYDPLTTNGRLHVWPTPDSVKDYLVLTARMPIEDFDSGSDDPDFPQEWLLPLAYNLAVLVAPKFNEETTPAFQMRAREFLMDATDSAADHGSLYLEMTQ